MNKILRNECNQGSKGVHAKNYKILLKESKGESIGKTSHLHELEVNIAKMFIFSKELYFCMNSCINLSNMFIYIEKNLL